MKSGRNSVHVKTQKHARNRGLLPTNSLIKKGSKMIDVGIIENTFAEAQGTFQGALGKSGSVKE